METHILPSYRETLEQLDTFNNLERTPPIAGSYAGGSERMARLMQRLGSPHTTIPALHIAGTKGKGSVSHLAAVALTATGFRTGLYTSPHVEILRERIMIHGRPIGEQAFVEACTTVMREAEAMRDSEGVTPSYFEVLTATAFTAFKTAKVEAMVLETGLGGRLDATNLPDLRLIAACITAISRDHEEILGHSLTEIAAEKADIIKKGIPTVTTQQEKGVMQLIREKANERNSVLFTTGKDVIANIRRDVTLDKPSLGQRLDLENWRSVYPDIPLAMLGSHQVDNAAMALGLVDLFLEYMDREPIDALVLKRAWRSLALPARMEVMSSSPWIIVDGAHNPASAWVAAETVSSAFSTKERTIIFGVAADKDWQAMLRILAPLFGRIVFTPFDSPRATEPEALAGFTSKEFPAIKTACAIDATHALELANEFTSADGLILVTGSLYLAGEMRKLCRKEKTSAI